MRKFEETLLISLLYNLFIIDFKAYQSTRNEELKYYYWNITNENINVQYLIMLLQVCKERNKLKEIEEMLQIYLYTIKTNIGVSLSSSKQCFSEKGWNASYEHEFILKS